MRPQRDNEATTKAIQRRDELEFLPAALEVLETPASPVGRAVALLIALLIVLALAWSYWGQMDMVAVAQGKLVPGGYVKVIQPLGLGVVRAIHVTEGQRVEAGQLLVELDPTESEVNKAQIIRALNAAHMEYERLNATWRGLDGGSTELDPLPQTDPLVVLSQQQKLHADLDEYHAGHAALESEAHQIQAERAAKEADVARLVALLPIVQEQEMAFRTLLERKVGSRLKWLEVKRTLIEKQQDMAVLQQQVLESDARLQANRKQQQRLLETFRRQIAGQRLEVMEQMAQSELELKSAESRESRNRLLAPVPGVVQQLRVHTQGGVVRPADTLMKIVPEGTPLIVEAVLQNKDIGFVKEGQEVEVKLESFPFTKYGLIAGTVSQLSADAVMDERQGLVYPIRVALSDDKIEVGDRWVKLIPGMAATAEIKIGTRRLIEFFLSPLLRYQNESLRER